jgi:hypothetical protein
MLRRKYKKKNGYPPCHMTSKFSQTPCRIQTRNQRLREGPSPRRLTKTLQLSSQWPMGTYHPHRSPDGDQSEGCCVNSRDTRQGPDRVCFSSRSGSEYENTLSRPIHRHTKDSSSSISTLKTLSSSVFRHTKDSVLINLGRPTYTTDVVHSISTSSLFLTILNGP